MKLVRKIFLGAMGIAFVTGCGSVDESTSSLDIINGVQAEEGGRIESSTVAIGAEGRFFCSGTLANDNTVITAAHCLQGREDGTVQIGFSRGGQITWEPTTSHAVHPRWNILFGNRFDIAVITMSGVAPEGYNPVKIYQGELNRGDELILAGFGQRENEQAGTLYYTDNPVQISRLSRNEIRYNFSDTQTGACFGDSGGPAYVDVDGELQVIGATSRGARNCRGFGVYINVLSHLDFLQENSSL
ncbi:MAG: trypsin-like serine protease [Pseudobacteriovorax sp.]|nr:trypsin-like serine protease [Pseudobacteriovorax sp.]